MNNTTCGCWTSYCARLLQTTVNTIHDCATGTSATTPGDINHAVHSVTREGLLQQPARVAYSVPRMSYLSGSQASNTERNKQPFSLIFQQTVADFTVLSKHMCMHFNNWFLHCPLFSSSTFPSASSCIVFLFFSLDFYGDSGFPRNQGGRGIRRRESE